MNQAPADPAVDPALSSDPAVNPALSSDPNYNTALSMAPRSSSDAAPSSRTRSGSGMPSKLGSIRRRWTAKKSAPPKACDWEGDKREPDLDDLVHSDVDAGDTCKWKGDPPEADTDDLAHGPAPPHQHLEPVEDDPGEPRKADETYQEMAPEPWPALETQPSPSIGSTRSREGLNGPKGYDSDSTRTVTNGTEHRRPTVASIPQPSAPAAAFPMTDDAPEPARKQSESEKETEAEPAEEPQETAPKQPDSWWKRLKEIADAEKERAYKKQAGEKAKKEEERARKKREKREKGAKKANKCKKKKDALPPTPPSPEREAAQLPDIAEQPDIRVLGYMPSKYAHGIDSRIQATPSDGSLCPGHRLLKEMKRQNN